MDSIQYLRSKGFNVLTGEACKFSLRLLVETDNESANEILRDFLGLPEMTLAPAWNRGIGSFMLTRGALQDLFLFCTLQEFEVMYKIEDTDSYYSEWQNCTMEAWQNEKHQKLAEWGVNYRVMFGDKETRNVHAFSGRVI